MKVNKTIYIIVALILGGLGVHKFYADQVGQGILHLVFFWTGIPSVVAIIHAIIVIFTKNADEYGYITFDKK
ncbi:TM2 domain-containing protein [Staphylococcus epidermidis]|uniref:TM2 domain-containing protein n=1 Tax=Staphylococcus epidermidis TaxID=1282 RepID=UPI001F35DD17|nr:NINE protein [Staphylococcus epidermidis]UJA40410.1 NINE protein [Staphylococcus epidermidis]